MDTVAMRLKQRRIECGFSTAADAARYLNVNAVTYAAHEAGSRGITLKMAKIYAKKYRTSTTWLLEGEGNKSKVVNPAIKIGSFNEVPVLTWDILTTTTTLREAMSAPSLPLQNIPSDIPVDSETAMLTTIDDSMANNLNASLPSFPRGNKLLFSSRQSPNPGDFVLCLPFGAKNAVFRHYLLDGVDDNGQDIIRLAALNPAYPSYTMSERRLGIIFGRLIARIDIY